MREQTTKPLKSVTFSDRALIPDNDPNYTKNPPRFFDYLRGIPRKLKFYEFVGAPIPEYSHDKIGSPAPLSLNSRGSGLRSHDFLSRIQRFLFNLDSENDQDNGLTLNTNRHLSLTGIARRLQLEDEAIFSTQPEKKDNLLALIYCFRTMYNDTTYNLITRILELLSHPLLTPEKKPEFRAFLSFLVGMSGVMDESDYYLYLRAFKEAWKDALFVASVLYQMDNGQIASEDKSIFSPRIYSIYRMDAMLNLADSNGAACSSPFFGLSRKERTAIDTVKQLTERGVPRTAPATSSSEHAPYFYESIPHPYYPVMSYSTANSALCYRLGKRAQQEDVCLLGDLPANWFTFADAADAKQEVAKRLWIAFANIDEQIYEEAMGTTACVTLYDGNDLLYTAAVGDSVAFAVVYDDSGMPIAAHRLNTLHKLHDEDERSRIGAQNISPYGKVERVGGGVIMTRAFGDQQYKANNLVAAPSITVHNLQELKGKSGSDSSYIELITTSDGFTDGAGIPHTTSVELTKEQQEEYLLSCLRNFHSQDSTRSDASTSSAPVESSLLLKAKFLAAAAEQDINNLKSISDNISVSVSQLNMAQPLLAATFDGHGGFKVSRQVASQMGMILRSLLERKEHVEDLLQQATEYHNQHHTGSNLQFEQEYRSNSQNNPPLPSCSSSM